MSHRSVTLATVRQSGCVCNLQNTMYRTRTQVIAYGCVFFTSDLMPSRDDPGVMTHDSCLILNPSLVSFLQHAEDGVGIDDRNDGAFRKIEVQ